MSTEKRRGSWLQTFTGRAFYPLDPRPEDVDIRDIAHALACTNRFNGHTRAPYSVAQHAVLVSFAAPPWAAFAALHHDDSEAYIGDMIRPLKTEMPEFQKIEAPLQAVIEQALGVDTSDPAIREAVRLADNTLLAMEKRDLCSESPLPWGPLPEPLETRVVPWAWHIAEETFLRRHEQLLSGKPWQSTSLGLYQALYGVESDASKRRESAKEIHVREAVAAAKWWAKGKQ